MRRSLITVLGLGLLTASSSSGAADAGREALKRALSEVVERPPLKNARVSVQVISLDRGDVVYAYHPDELLNPASNVKLFTAAGALLKLGAEYRWETEFHVDAPLSNGRAKTLFVRGRGDPSLTTERLYQIISELRHQGLREVTDLVLDDTYFDSERLAPGYEQETSDRAYMAPNGALSLNANTVGIYVRPADQAGQKPVVEVDPPSEFFDVIHRVKGGGRLRRVSVSSDAAGDKQQIVVDGVVPSDGQAFAVWKKIDNPVMYFGQTLKAMLKERGVPVKGKIRLGTAPTNAQLLHISLSDTLDIVLKRLNKNSINFTAEMLVKTVGAEGRGAPGTSAKGVEVIEELLETEIGIPRGTYVMKNGSGLNDTNRFSAAQLARLLKVMIGKLPLAPEYLSSMGIAGKDGTLKYRFEGSDAAGRLRAKTGTLQNTSALSGYVESVGGERFAFAIIVNDYPSRAEKVTRSIDAMGAAVASSGSAQGPARAAAAMMAQPTEVAPIAEAMARIKTYLALGQQKDRRNLTFLRTSWRAEKDPAVRTVLAEAMYRSSPEDYQTARALLDSFAASDDVYGRLREIAARMQTETPAVGSLVEMAAEGHLDAMGKLIELARASQKDEAAFAQVAKDLAEVGKTAPDELIISLKRAPAADRDSALQGLAQGLVQLAEMEHPLWPALKKAMASLDREVAAFAKEAEGVLAIRIAEAKAPEVPQVPVVAPSTRPDKQAPQTAESRPGG